MLTLAGHQEESSDMTEYDADQPPLPEDWLRLDEQERIAIVAGYHYRAGVGGRMDGSGEGDDCAYKDCV